MNNPVKQKDIVRWHRNMGNMISVVTETKLKGKSGYLGVGIAIIMDASLAKHVCKVFKMPSRLISVRLLFKNKLLVTVLGLYADATVIVDYLGSQVK
ncbi:hypothetical protein G9A89_020187 [Geosiphon pyriformis]|nr:hypothetical protein G9A89_020187 [Geosiphon pyriformis]